MGLAPGLSVGSAVALGLAGPEGLSAGPAVEGAGVGVGGTVGVEVGGAAGAEDTAGVAMDVGGLATGVAVGTGAEAQPVRTKASTRSNTRART